MNIEQAHQVHLWVRWIEEIWKKKIFFIRFMFCVMFGWLFLSGNKSMLHIEMDGYMNDKSGNQLVMDFPYSIFVERGNVISLFFPSMESVAQCIAAGTDRIQWWIRQQFGLWMADNSDGNRHSITHNNHGWKLEQRIYENSKLENWSHAANWLSACVYRVSLLIIFQSSIDGRKKYRIRWSRISIHNSHAWWRRCVRSKKIIP